MRLERRSVNIRQSFSSQVVIFLLALSLYLRREESPPTLLIKTNDVFYFVEFLILAGICCSLLDNTEIQSRSSPPFPGCDLIRFHNDQHHAVITDRKLTHIMQITSFSHCAWFLFSFLRSFPKSKSSADKSSLSGLRLKQELSIFLTELSRLRKGRGNCKGYEAHPLVMSETSWAYLITHIHSDTHTRAHAPSTRSFLRMSPSAVEEQKKNCFAVSALLACFLSFVLL